MPVITFTDFSFGKDLRKGVSTSDANRLRELKNGFIPIDNYEDMLN